MICPQPSSKGGRADPAAIAAAAAAPSAAAPSAFVVTLGCITRAAVVHRLSCSFKGASSCRPAALALSWSGCPTSAREGGGKAVMKSARASAERAQLLSSSPPDHAAHLPTCVQLPLWDER